MAIYIEIFHKSTYETRHDLTKDVTNKPNATTHRIAAGLIRYHNLGFDWTYRIVEKDSQMYLQDALSVI